MTLLVDLVFQGDETEAPAFPVVVINCECAIKPIVAAFFRHQLAHLHAVALQLCFEFGFYLVDSQLLATGEADYAQLVELCNIFIFTGQWYGKLVGGQKGFQHLQPGIALVRRAEQGLQRGCCDSHIHFSASDVGL